MRQLDASQSGFGVLRHMLLLTAVSDEDANRPSADIVDGKIIIVEETSEVP